jgi:predicted permease
MNKRVSSFWRNLLRRDRVERELDDELHATFDLLVDEKMRAGMATDEARRAARLELGSVGAIKDGVRDARMGAYVETFFQDICHAWRRMRSDPAFTIVAALTLALAVGANTAVFTIVNAAVLKPLPVHEPQRLVLVELVTQRGERQNFSYPLFERLRAQDGSFAGVLATLDGTDRMELTGREPGAPAQHVTVSLVSKNYFDVLGVRAALGRTFGTGDDRDRGDDSAAVLSYGFWTRRFGADPAAIGTTLVVKEQALTVVGVAPAAFFGAAVGEAPDIWVPLEMQPRFDRGASLLQAANVGWLRVMARRRPDVEEEQAGAALAVMLARLKAEPGELGAFRYIGRLEPSGGSLGFATFRERFSTSLRILAVIAAVVLLIACANVSNLLLVKAAARRREMSVRRAIGASRGRLIRQLLTESVLLATAAGAFSVLLAWWGSRLLLTIASGDGTPIPIDVTPDARVLTFAAAVSVASVVIFGLTPALIASHVGRGMSLRQTASAQTRATLSQTLVVAQVALSLVLLTGAGLFVQTLRNLRTRDLGFAADSLLEVRVRPEPGGYREGQVDLSRRLHETLAAAPGVQSATFAHSGFGTGIARTCCLAVEGYEHQPGEDRQIRTLGVAPGYFLTMRLPLLRGRDFRSEEGAADPRQAISVAVVNEAFIRRYVDPARNPIGARFGWGDPPTVTYGAEIIGIATDAVHDDPREEVRPLIYVPFLWGDTFLLRAAGPPDAVMAAVRQRIGTVDRDLEISMRTVSDAVDNAVTREALLSKLSGFFGVLAVMLAAIGLYGIMAFAVVRRTNEIGIRMALGAARGAVLRGVLGSALRLVCVGVCAGAPVALVAGHLIRSQLFGVSANDPVTLAFAALLLTLVAGAAAYIPAHRAARVEPVVALRSE